MVDKNVNKGDSQDITKLLISQKKEIERLKEENNILKNKVLNGNRLHYFLDILNKGFLLIKENKIVDCNDKLVDIFGYYNKNDIIGKMPFELPIQNDFLEKLYMNNKPFSKNEYDNIAFKCKYCNLNKDEGLIHVDIVSYNNNNKFIAYVFLTVTKNHTENTGRTNISMHSQYSFIHGHMATIKPNTIELLVEADTGIIVYVNPFTYECIDSNEPLIGKKIYNCPLAKAMPLYPVIFSHFESCEEKAFPVAKNTENCDITHGIVTSNKLRIGEKEYISIRTTDTTKNIRHMDRLRKNEKKYIDIFNNVNDAIYIYSFGINEESRFIDVNDVACNRLGYSKEELLDLPISSIKTKEESYKIFSRMKELDEKEQLFFESEHISRHGDVIPVEINSRKLNLFGEDIVISVARDITRRKWIENFLIQSEERNRRLVDLLPNPVILVKDACIVYANGSAKEFMAVGEKELLIGKRLSNLFVAIDDRSAKIFHGVLNDDIESSKQYEEIKLLRVKDRIEIDVELTTSLFKYSNKEVKVLHFRDLKHVKRSQKFERLFSDAMRYDTLKTLFFANLSHEFRTPLNVMLSAIQVLIGIIDEDDKNFNSINMISNKLKLNCYRLLRLVTNLIDLTKFDSGFYDMHSENCNIVNLVENICDYSSDKIKEQGIKLVFDTDSEEIIIACDPYKIDRIMLNLLSNAIKFTEHGGTINVSIKTFSDYIEIYIKDNGIGIPKEMLALIFKHFNQIDKSFTRKNEGCGIGLTLVKYLVQMHNGNISATSEVGKGSEFVIRLPIVIVDEKKSSSTENRDIGYKNTIDIEFSDIYAG